MKEEGYFGKALSGLVRDVACGDAIRHLADLGYSPIEIQNQLDYPTSVQLIGEEMFRHFLDRGIILPEKPTGKVREESTYLREYDTFGRASYRKVTSLVELPGEDYVELSFGKEMRSGRDNLAKRLSGLGKADLDYVLSLPWPLAPVYHVKNERIMRILEQMEKGKESV